jgi:hypothetical protein
VAQRDGGFELRDREAVLAEARHANLDFEVPAPVSAESAEAGSARSPLHEGHPFPGCFVCGPGRESPDGLRVIPGPLEDRSAVAATWTPDRSLADPDDVVFREFVWAVMDCPTGNSMLVDDNVGPDAMYLLGRLSGEILSPVRASTTYVVLGWPVANEGRKFTGGCAIFDPDGKIVAKSLGLWIAIRSD